MIKHHLNIMRFVVDDRAGLGMGFFDADGPVGGGLTFGGEEIKFFDGISCDEDDGYRGEESQWNFSPSDMMLYKVSDDQKNGWCEYHQICSAFDFGDLKDEEGNDDPCG